jgi:hypothetical protein
MTKPENDEIKIEDIKKYLDMTSDFAFEMKVLNLLNGQGLKTSFGGLYQDPNTKHTRQFDIRAKMQDIENGMDYSTLFAIECKNLRDNFPLLVLGTKRRNNESFVNVWQFKQLRHEDNNNGLISSCLQGYFVHTEKLQPSMFYMVNNIVGRSLAQIRKTKGGIESGDFEVYNKWTQSLSSIHGLMATTVNDLDQQVEQKGFASGCFVFIPILVVPDGKLWFVEYSEDGELCGEPNLVEKCSYLVNKGYYLGNRLLKPCRYTVSHLEIMTFTGLKKFLENKEKQVDIFRNVDKIS